MRAPDDDPGEAGRSCFQCGQITDAAFVGPTAVVDDEDVARVSRFHRFEKNIHTAEMLCRKSAASRSIVSIDRMNTERRDANRSAKAQRRIRNQRRRKL